MQKIICYSFAALWLILGHVIPAFPGMGSTSYQIPTSIFSGGGVPMSTVSNDMNSTLGQPSPLTDQDNPPNSPSYSLYPGFWYTIGEIAGFRITFISQNWSGNNNVTITWESAPGESYDILLKDEFTGTFTKVATVVASGATASWTDDGTWSGGTRPTTVQQRYYKVSSYGTDSENIVGMYKCIRLPPMKG